MVIGTKVKVLECHKYPELVGQEAEVIAMVAPEVSPYQIKVKMTSGEHEGQVCGFREDELEEIQEKKTEIPQVFEDA